jgi:dTDP-4-dehydrorhamnose reductase
MNDTKIFIVGAKGQLGLALQAQYPNAQSADIDELDITDVASVAAFDWSQFDVVLNAAAFTNVDGAETVEGRTAAWNVNAAAVALLARAATKYNFTLVHISSDYVFDGTLTPHTETELYAPLSVYGASKAAGDTVVSMTDQHYLVRTSWVIGEGKNFVRTMLDLAKRGINPSVVDDQIGRLTFTSELVRGIDHLLTSSAPYGTYNITNDGEPVSWAAITRLIYADAQLPNIVTSVTTAEYFAGKVGIAIRPHYSTLDLSKLIATGFKTRNWETDLQTYVRQEIA